MAENAIAMSYRQLPNYLTVARLALAACFFLALNQYRYPGVNAWALGIAFAFFVLAALTDWADGYLARRWHVESTFGRIMDPFCDKVLVIGALIYLSGPRFVDPAAVAAGSFFTMASGLYPWMVALMLARELLVTGIRGELEGQGIEFGANRWGKLKTVLHLVGIPALLVVLWLDPSHPDWRWLVWPRDVLVYTMVLVTVASGLPYVREAARQLGKK